MIIPFLVFWLLLGWGLYDGDLDTREAVIFGTIWVVSILGLLLFKRDLLWLVPVTVVLDIVLIMKIFGQDIQIH